MERTAGRTVEFLKGALQARARAERRAGQVLLSVTIDNLTGHKLPTGFPSRRLWIHVRATDLAEKVVFESGSWDADTGELTVGTEFQPHYAAIETVDEVMIYEAEYYDVSGRPTLSLARAASYRKDNRILPRGFDENRASPLGFAPGFLGPAGVKDDADFQPGSDTILYRLPSATAVTVEVLFQTIKPAHARAVHFSFDPRPAVLAHLTVNVP
jgi:hypothetical protein